MDIKINIPEEFEKDYLSDRFKDFFSRVIADIDCHGLCGNYEKEIAEMFIEAFDKSEIRLKLKERREYVPDTNVGSKDGWIPVEERLPEEHDSMFKEWKGTDKWNEAMFEKISDEVIVTVEYENGERRTKTSHTTDGKWSTRQSIVPFKVIAWMPLPEPYKEE